MNTNERETSVDDFMTITLTPSELQDFSIKLSKWYADRAEYVLRNLKRDDMHAGAVYSGAMARQDEMLGLLNQFEKANPKPDWRTLL